MNLKRHVTTGLSRIELVVLVAMLGLIIVCVLPMLLPHRGAAKIARRTACIGNLKQVGLSFLIYANDNGNEFPWMVSTNFNPTNASGSLEFTNSAQVFRHFQAASNELNTPKVLRCPSDAGRQTAPDFANFGNTNVSYFVGLDARQDSQEMLLSGDRNITGGTLSNGFLRVLQTNTPAGWTPAIHKNAGNIGLADGSVLQANPPTLQRQLQMQTFNDIRLAIP